MATMTLELPAHTDQKAFNLGRWRKLLADRELARFEGRIETDRHGRIIMSPPPAPSHGSFQVEIAHQLRLLLKEGRVITECPISTADGVKAADVAWASSEGIEALGELPCFVQCPEICVEVISPANTSAEMNEKVALDFNAGAEEVWLCDPRGKMSFFLAASKRSPVSRLCPEFPRILHLG